MLNSKFLVRLHDRNIERLQRQRTHPKRSQKVNRLGKTKPTASENNVEPHVNSEIQSLQ